MTFNNGIPTKVITNEDTMKKMLFECRAVDLYKIVTLKKHVSYRKLIPTTDLYHGFTFLYSSSIFVLPLTSGDLKS